MFYWKLFFYCLFSLSYVVVLFACVFINFVFHVQMNVSSYFGMMINVTRNNSPTAESNFVTLILKLLMTLLWTVNTPHDKIDEHRPTRKSEKWLSPFCLLNVKHFFTAMCYLHPEDPWSYIKNIFSNWNSPCLTLEPFVVGSRFAALRVGEKGN